MSDTAFDGFCLLHQGIARFFAPSARCQVFNALAVNRSLPSLPLALIITYIHNNQTRHKHCRYELQRFRRYRKPPNWYDSSSQSMRPRHRQSYAVRRLSPRPHTNNFFFACQAQMFVFSRHDNGVGMKLKFIFVLLDEYGTVNGGGIDEASTCMLIYAHYPIKPVRACKSMHMKPSRSIYLL